QLATALIKIRQNRSQNQNPSSNCLPGHAQSTKRVSIPAGKDINRSERIGDEIPSAEFFYHQTHCENA
ncbi:hypothetical protein, partial [Anaerotruncus massiliensis (ex Liu et al. 2021)]|uniref:hypothetical protein n=1 Tax=Anaerotruncus massiliensis (ex Liu et al. 2021) TaxID=2321404 RepID=UPI003AB4B268